MLALEEKNNLSNELGSTKKKLEEIGSQKVLDSGSMGVIEPICCYYSLTA